MKNLALAQVIADNSNVEKFLSYKKAMFPWLEESERQEKGQRAQALLREVSRGPLGVRPMAIHGYESRLAKKIPTSLSQEVTHSRVRRNTHGK